MKVEEFIANIVWKSIRNMELKSVYDNREYVINIRHFCIDYLPEIYEVRFFCPLLWDMNNIRDLAVRYRTEFLYTTETFDGEYEVWSIHVGDLKTALELYDILAHRLSSRSNICLGVYVLPPKYDTMHSFFDSRIVYVIPDNDKMEPGIYLMKERMMYRVGSFWEPNYKKLMDLLMKNHHGNEKYSLVLYLKLDDLKEYMRRTCHKPDI